VSIENQVSLYRAGRDRCEATAARLPFSPATAALVAPRPNSRPIPTAWI